MDGSRVWWRKLSGNRGKYGEQESGDVCGLDNPRLLGRFAMNARERNVVLLRLRVCWVGAVRKYTAACDRLQINFLSLVAFVVPLCS